MAMTGGELKGLADPPGGWIDIGIDVGVGAGDREVRDRSGGRRADRRGLGGAAADQQCGEGQPSPSRHRGATTTPPPGIALTGAHPDGGEDHWRRSLQCRRGDHFLSPAPTGVAAPAPAPAVFWKLYVPPNFLLNFSTRLAVSTNFCLPVKNGWQAEQISTLMRFSVLRVVNVLPQAQ